MRLPDAVGIAALDQVGARPPKVAVIVAITARFLGAC
jgi:hypothetical protein